MSDELRADYGSDDIKRILGWEQGACIDKEGHCEFCVDGADEDCCICGKPLLWNSNLI